MNDTALWLRQVFILLCSVCICLQLTAKETDRAQSGKKIVVSIEPYALMLNSIKTEQDSVSVLLEKAVGAHSFSLRPSHLQDLSEADLFIWGGPTLEPFLENAAKKAKHQLILSELSGLTLLHAQDGHAHHDGAHTIDPHIWLSASNVKVITAAMALTLNYPASLTQVSDSQTGLEVHDAFKQKKSLMVYHDAYSYLENDLGLQKAFVLNNAHDAKAGLKQWQNFQIQLKKHQQENKAICLVGPKGFQQSSEAEKIKGMLNKLDMQNQVTWLEIDPLAQDKIYSNYANFLNHLREQLLKCVD